MAIFHCYVSSPEGMANYQLVDHLPIVDGDVQVRYVKLPEGNV